MADKDTETSSFIFGIDKTFFLASLPFIGYLVSYSFNIGFYDFYDLPLFLVPVDIPSILLSNIAVLGIGSIVFSLSTIVFMVSFREQLKLALFVVPMSILVALGVVILLAPIHYEFIKLIGLPSLIAGAFLLLIIDAFLFVKEEHKKEDASRTRASYYLLYLTLVIATMISAFGLGHFFAKNQQNHAMYMESSTCTYIVLVNNTDRFTVMQLHRIGKNSYAMTGNFKFIPSDEKHVLVNETAKIIPEYPIKQQDTSIPCGSGNVPKP
jgi:hypothetical protein